MIRIERVNPTNFVIYRQFLHNAAEMLSTRYGYSGRFSFLSKLKDVNGRMTVCVIDGECRGVMWARLGPSSFSPNKLIYQQKVLYTVSSRATYHLLKEFIDFGKNHADHIITMIGRETNIKPSSLEKLGFKELETYYRMET